MRLWVLIMLVLVGEVGAEPIYRKSTNYYFVSGGSALILMRQFSEKGPTGLDGDRHIFAAQWEVQWKIKYQTENQKCRPGKVTTIIGMTTTLPKRGKKPVKTGELEVRWAGMLEAIEKHEKFHEKQARLAGKMIERAILDLEPGMSCDFVKEAASKVANKILRDQRKVSQDYDMNTNYGADQGITLL
tara:strand:+ start:165 stop:725 length:561 start_codon:yes stop_codon:yes gene_type:complete